MKSERLARSGTNPAKGNTAKKFKENRWGNPEGMNGMSITPH